MGSNPKVFRLDTDGSPPDREYEVSLYVGVRGEPYRYAVAVWYTNPAGDYEILAAWGGNDRSALVAHAIEQAPYLIGEARALEADGGGDDTKVGVEEHLDGLVDAHNKGYELGRKEAAAAAPPPPAPKSAPARPAGKPIVNRVHVPRREKRFVHTNDWTVSGEKWENEVLNRLRRGEVVLLLLRDPDDLVRYKIRLTEADLAADRQDVRLPFVVYEPDTDRGGPPYRRIHADAAARAGRAEAFGRVPPVR